MFNLWLDDVRDPKHPQIVTQHLYLLEGVWIWARTAVEAIELLKTGHVNMASFDHDLGLVGIVSGDEANINYDLNAREVINFLINAWNREVSSDGFKSFWPRQEPYYHTANIVGRDWMKGMVDRYGPYKK